MKSGILYALSNENWNSNLLKCGRTNNVKRRIKEFQTASPIDCKIEYVTNELLNVNFYENYLKKILKELRYRTNREFYIISHERIKEIYDLFNELNNIYNTEEKLNEYINTVFPIKKIAKKRKIIFINTRNKWLMSQGLNQSN